VESAHGRLRAIDNVPLLIVGKPPGERLAENCSQRDPATARRVAGLRHELWRQRDLGSDHTA